VEKVGGASVQENAHRRSVYTFRKRTSPPDNMLIFDAGSREVCQPKRLNTNTPLQALVLLNNPGFVESAQQIALRISKEATDPKDQIALAFRHVCTRSPRPTELTALVELYTQQKAQLAQLAPVAPVVPVAPEPKPDSKANAEPKGKRAAAPTKAAAISADPALAALTLVCSTILASDAAVTSR
jgi:hypothetical protein